MNNLFTCIYYAARVEKAIPQELYIQQSLNNPNLASPKFRFFQTGCKKIVIRKFLFIWTKTAGIL
jgi:hypothetical protein